ncbi:MAG: N-acetyl-gamma-glutamyl-phosphate reductase [Alphaproteobacteria bacterium]|nr:N-acetyl-gamma-glutamyl-phosphate reductase [Alphaproteobacteria bacterium]MDE2042331.1 N-acetyl-gamma-glutamyl-phosphate reductase [Alphaproteobacteria bacterium]MDE2340179.1 N-acetyl-gamma-glutamyl-phosphate reductase [Alphaproteobacteria bacterium]
MTTHVFIDGAAGTTGLEIHERLANRADLVLIRLDEVQRKSDLARRDAINSADLVILCLPDDAARAAVAMIDNAHTRVIDASTAHRVAPGWTYGFPEISGSGLVAQARFVSNPGCYPTGFIALVAPLLRYGLIDVAARLACDAVSGYSGGGRAMIAAYEGQERAFAWSSYGLSLDHKHVPEMRKHAGLTHAPLFTPAVVNTYRGMIVNVSLTDTVLENGVCADDIRAAYQATFGESVIVRRIAHWPATSLPVEHAAGRDTMDIFLFENPDLGQIRLVAALDNLGKGAAGAAVQNLNIMLGFDEGLGLRI